MELSHAGLSLQRLRDQAALHREGLARILDSVMTAWFERLEVDTPMT